jgi:hypothetical protein
MRPLGLEDIAELRAYERVRDHYRAQVIELKRRRRVALGPIISVVFDCPETVRFQIQEMARAEKISTDEGILAELEVYNRLLPGGRELSATLFIELTTEADLHDWLPRLVGIERSVAIELAGGEVIWSRPEQTQPDVSSQEVTPALHYVRFACTPAEAEGLAAAPAALTVRHSEYEARTELSEVTRTELVADLTASPELLPLG